MLKCCTYFLIVLLCFVEKHSVRSDDDNGSKCDIANVVWGIPVDANPVNDNDAEVTLWTTKYSGPLDVTNLVIYNNKNLKQDDIKKYIAINTASGQLTISTTKDWPSFETVLIHQKSTDITLYVYMKCSTATESILMVSIKVKDINNHDPEFNQTTYTFHIGMPAPSDISLNTLDPTAEIIESYDLDYTNSEITFNIQDGEKIFEIISSAVNDNPLHDAFSASICFSKPVDFEEDQTFKIIATDSGNPKRSSSVNLIITVDKTKSIPKFSQSVYTFTIVNKEDITSDGNITVINGDIGTSSTFTLSDYADNFELTPDKDTITIKVKETLPDALLNQPATQITLTLSTEDRKISTVLLFLADVEPTGFKFEKDSYVYVLNDGTLTPQSDEAHLTGTIPTDVSVLPTDKGNFEVNYDDKTKIVNIKFVGSLEVYKKSYLELDLTAESQSKLASTHIMVTVAPLKIDFFQASYQAKYTILDKDNNAMIEFMDFVSIKDDKKESIVNVCIDEGSQYASNFEMSKNTTNKWQLDTLNPLSESDLTTKKTIDLTIIAKIDDLEKDRAIITLDLPEQQEQPAFDSFSYTASYNVSDKGDIHFDMEQDILLLSKYATISQATLGGELKGYFKVVWQEQKILRSYHNSSITLEASDKIPKEILETVAISTLGLDVVLTTEDVLHASIVVKLPKFYKGSDNGGGDDGDKNEDDSSDTAYIAAIAVISVLFALYIVGTIVLYCTKLRSSRRVSKIVLETATPEPEQHFAKKTSVSNMKTSKDLSTRRPTGFIRYNPKDMDDDDEDLDDSTVKKVPIIEEEVHNSPANAAIKGFSLPDDNKDKKSVAFDEIIHHIEIDPSDKDNELIGKDNFGYSHLEQMEENRDSSS